MANTRPAIELIQVVFLGKAGRGDAGARAQDELVGGVRLIARAKHEVALIPGREAHPAREGAVAQEEPGHEEALRAGHGAALPGKNHSVAIVGAGRPHCDRW